MAHYGNILTVFSAGSAQLAQVEAVLISRGTDFERKDNAFFVETKSKGNTDEVIRDLNQLGIEFVFFHNHISNGSKIKSAGIDQAVIDHIDKILFE